ncbi:MAG: tocopherol cyclase family protein [Acidobacteriota bacterium]
MNRTNINFADNECRFSGQRTGHYEVWFITLNDPISGCGFWFRYTIDVRQGTTQPEPGLWGCFFHAHDHNKTFGLRRSFPASAWQTSNASEGLVIGIGQNALHNSRLYGRLAEGGRSISWDLKLEPATETFQHIDPLARDLFKPKTLICAPNLAVKFSGRVEVNGEEFQLEKAVGCQQHIWGSKHTESWAWAHCNFFENEPDAVFEGLAARPKRGPFTMPPLTLAYLRYRGEHFYFNKIRHLIMARNRFGDFEWQFTTGDSLIRLYGEASALTNNMLQVEYPDPDGARTFCLNSEIGSLTLNLERRSRRFTKWQPFAKLISSGTTHFERASRIRQPLVPLI